MNNSQIGQFSLSAKLGFNLVQQTRGEQLDRRNTVATVKVTQLALLMINRHLLPPDAPTSSATREVMLPPSRINVDFKRVESVPDDCQSTRVSAFIEPIAIKIGFRDLIFFRSLAQNYQTAMGSIQKPAESSQPAPVQSEEQKKKQKVKKVGYGVDALQLEVRVDPMQLLMVDDTQQITQQLFRVLLSSLIFNLSSTNLLEESMRATLKESPDQLKAKGKFSIEAMFYNNAVSEYEPVVEGWSLELNLVQTAADRGREILIKADKLLNLNMSYVGIPRESTLPI